ncbi:hypothetical protein ACQ5SO_09565 [Rhodovulum sp. DZ06]|uniref:hypothetical protein n=1 Tax=Rhodovulum sp. DZ06 TaxID=3425126 RepID=UPI003D3414A4
MPLPVAALPPLALKLGGYALVAAAAWTAARKLPADAPRDAGREAALDGMPEGVRLTRASLGDDARMDADARLARVLRLGPNGPGVAAEFTGLARLRLRRLRG